MEYTEKLAIANTFISKYTDGLEWNDLADINSLNDCDTQENIFEACKERLEDSGFPMDIIDDDENDSVDNIPADKIEDIDDIIMSEEDDDDVLITNEY